MASSYKIPQNVELEDKILGPFTLRQFLYLLAGGMVTFVNFSTVYTVSQTAFFVTTFVIWAVVVAFVFVKPYDQPFLKFITSFINFTTRPSRRAWKRLPTLAEIKLQDRQAPPKVVKQEPSDEEVRSKLSKLAHVVDSRGWNETDDDETAGRVTSEAAARPQLNIFMAHEDEPADILAREDSGAGSDRASTKLDTVLRESERQPQTAPTGAGNQSQGA